MTSSIIETMMNIRITPMTMKTVMKRGEGRQKKRKRRN